MYPITLPHTTTSISKSQKIYHQARINFFMSSIAGTSKIQQILSQFSILSWSTKVSFSMAPKLKNFSASFSNSCSISPLTFSSYVLKLKMIVVVSSYSSSALRHYLCLNILKPRLLSIMRGNILDLFLLNLTEGIVPSKGKRLRVSQTMRHCCPPQNTRISPQDCLSMRQVSLSYSRVILLALYCSTLKYPCSLKSANSSPITGAISWLRSISVSLQKQLKVRCMCPMNSSQTDKQASRCQVNSQNSVWANLNKTARVGRLSFPLLMPRTLLQLPPSLITIQSQS